ncbi:MAG: hypothetical protein ABIY70_13520 [Capsulimonas sp.]|uniref:hypothetical protein n=1 Tax=Capsulimonas sp. TaxID=2494211 RepID=UPI003265941E
MTKMIHAALAPAILAVSISVIAAPAPAAPAHSLAPLVSEIQSSPGRVKAKSLSALTGRSSVISQIAISSKNAPKTSDLTSIQSISGFTAPKPMNHRLASRFRTLAATVSKAATQEFDTNSNDKKLTTGGPSHASLLMSEISAAPKLKTQPRQ